MTLSHRSPWLRGLDAFLPGLYAWATTVAWEAFDPAVSQIAKIVAAIALFSLGLASLLKARQSSWADWVAVVGFLGSCMVVWGLLTNLPERVVGWGWRGWIGVLAWAVFATGWVRVRVETTSADVVPRNAGQLTARAKPAWGGTLAWVVGGLGGFGLLASPWTVAVRERAILTQAVAVLGALSIVRAAERLATGLSLGQVGASQARRVLLGTGWVLLGTAGGVWLTWVH